MRKIVRAACVWVLALLVFTIAHGTDNMWDYSVQADVVVQAAPPKITLNWLQDSKGVPAGYAVSRKAPGAVAWGPETKLAGTVTTYVDTDVAVGRAYEYRIVKTTGTYSGYGYVQAGIEVPLVDDRGTIVLIVDQTHARALAPELARLQEDLVGDGWQVRRHDVARRDSVVSVKKLILDDYNADRVRVKSVFLFGHVPVPYSGKLNPDTHPDHVGAWPADAYYGDMHGVWTDVTVDYQQTLNRDTVDAARLSNVPGDGKFDQSDLPAGVELQVGRVDLANLPGRKTPGGEPTFQSEEQLLRQYLNKDHDFRHGLLSVKRRAIVGDYFGLRGGEAFSASGYRNFAPLVGTKNITNLNLEGNNLAGERWISALASRDYLLAYGCGPGSYGTIDGIGHNGRFNEGTTVDVVSNDVRAVFTLIFGSWLGDWDHEDDIMRSVLAAPTCTLATVWSGRPHWFVHPMGLGETIGYTTRLTQTNRGLYQNQVNLSVNQIHIALMGDPTLRLSPVMPAGMVRGKATATGTALTWAPSSDLIVGYHVYRALPSASKFVRLTETPVADVAFTDRNAPVGATYMVRAVKLEITPSGSYLNASQGAFWSTGEAFAGAGERTPTWSNRSSLAADRVSRRAEEMMPQVASHPASAAP